LEPITALAGSLGSVSPWLLASTGALSVIGLLVSLAALVLTARKVDLPRLGLVRWGCTVLTGLLVAASLVYAVRPWALALSCIGFLVSLQATALPSGPLKPLWAYLERGTPAGDPGWWREFERDMRRYARSGRADDNQMQRAVTRTDTPRPEAPDGEDGDRQ
jgi:hypothetical protein